MRWWKRHNDKSTDENVLLRCFQQSGDLQVLEQLFSPYMPLVYGVAMKYLEDREAAKDMVMEIFEQLITKLPGQEIQNFRAWLYVFTKNACLMWIRKNGKEREATFVPDDLSFFMENGQELHPLDGENDREQDLQILEDCIEGLEAAQKCCIQLFYLENESYRSIVEKTEYELKKVKSHIQNGKRNLKNCMESRIERE